MPRRTCGHSPAQAARPRREAGAILERDEFRRPRGQRQADLQTRPSGWKPGTLWEEIHTLLWRRGRKREPAGKIILRSCFNLTLCAIKT